MTPVSVVVERVVTTICLALPPLSLAVMAIAWVHHGIDLPYYDDWRGYRSGRIGSLAPGYLFEPAHDTLYAVGKLLDSLAQRYLNGNCVAYQLLSMLTVLGSILWLQWRLLLHTLKDRFAAATAFAATIFTLQPGGYWGFQNMAYHQAIPLVCLLAAFYILLVTNWRNWLKMTWLLAIGTISGLAYISGAFSILAVAIILLVFCVLYPQQRPRFLCSGLVLLVAGAVTSMAQLWVIVVVQHGQTHRPHTAPWAFPDERQFWAFILGKIGRSLMLLPGAPLLSLKALFLFLLLSLVLLGLLFKRASQPRYFDERTISVLVISLSMVAAIGVYLFMVAAGRANFGVATKDANFVGIFVSGFARFHFFWVTVLWPWVFAIGVIVFGTTSRIRLGSGALALGLLVFAISRGAMSHDAIFRKIANQRIQNDLVCLQDALIKQKEIRCPTLNVRDLSRAYAFAVETGASFVKYFPLTLRSGNPNVATYSILSMSPRAYKVSQAEVVTASVDGIELGAGSDPKILFQTGHPDVMADCLGLQVSASITVGRADDARLFYMVAGQKEFEEGRSLGKPVPRNQVQMIDFVVTSHSGFRDRLRLDPVASSQPSKVGPITVRCLLSIPKDGIPKNNLRRPLAIARTAPTLSPQSPPSNVTDSKLADRAMSRSLSE